MGVINLENSFEIRQEAGRNLLPVEQAQMSQHPFL